MVIFSIPSDETRSVDELAALPAEELETLFSGEPAAVLVAMPGEDGIPVLGTGAVTEPGRYVAVCNIPQGADPAAYLAAMQSGSDDAPEVEGGAPHFTLGMYAGFTVE